MATKKQAKEPKETNLLRDLVLVKKDPKAIQILTKNDKFAPDTKMGQCIRALLGLNNDIGLIGLGTSWTFGRTIERMAMKKAGKEYKQPLPARSNRCICTPTVRVYVKRFLAEYNKV